MKFILVSIILSVFIHAGEMDRIEAIVKDIENLRKDYQKCLVSKEKAEKSKQDLIKVSQSVPVNAEAKEYKKLLEKQTKQNLLLSSELESLKKSLNQSKIYMKTIDDDKAIYQKKLDEKDSKIAKYKTDVNKLQLALETAKKDAEESKKKLDEKDSKIAKYKIDVNKLQIALETAKKDAIFTQKKLADKESQLTTYKSEVSSLNVSLKTTKEDLLETKESFNQYKMKNKTNKENIDKSNKNYKIIVKEKDKELYSLKSEYKKIILDKEKTIFSLENEIKEYKEALVKKPKVIEKVVEKIVEKSVKKTACKDENEFPKLLMKDGKVQVTEVATKDPTTKVEKNTKQTIQKASSKKSIKSEKIKPKEAKVQAIVYAAVQVKVDTKPSVYRLSTDTKVYSDINGTVVAEWENKTSFTSTKMSQNWVKVSGHFQNGKWTRAKESLWIKKENAIKR